ncbi:MAG: carbohydrate kinase family protein [Chloroflexi bacterium]|nr:MAG: carbohydrate kinase family protein [Chloroflexota bacterium]
MTRADLWVLGNLTIDDLVLPDGTTSMGLCGGNAIFAALGGRVWSEHVGLAARVGPDFPRSNIRRLEAAGIQLALSEVDAPTLHNWALYESADRRRFVEWLDSGSHLEQSLVPGEVPAAARLARVCHVAPMPLEVQSRLVRFLKPRCALVSLDPHDEYIQGAEDALLDLLGLVDLFLPSRREAALLYGRDAPEEAARTFLRRGPRAVAVKLGAEGSLVCGRGVEPVHVPAVPVVALDPTGAGDAYCGAFCVSYGQHGDVREAALHATVAGSLMVERRGALGVLPFDTDVTEQRLERLRDRLKTKRTETDRRCAWITAN